MTSRAQFHREDAVVESFDNMMLLGCWVADLCTTGGDCLPIRFSVVGSCVHIPKNSRLRPLDAASSVS
jgi:hypothetical protein